MKLEGKTAFVTGTSRGIGLSLCGALLAKGCRVAGLGLHAPSIRDSAFKYFKTDVRDAKSVDKAVAQALKWAKNRVDVLINNAGLGYFGDIEDLPVGQWHEMFSVNVDGVFHTCRRIVPLMKKRGLGHIMNIASTAALEGFPGASGYCATKWAVRGMSESLWRELREHGIKVTCVCPGTVKTDFFKKRPDHGLMPEDVAAVMVRVLESPDSLNQVNLEIRPIKPKRA